MRFYATSLPGRAPRSVALAAVVAVGTLVGAVAGTAGAISSISSIDAAAEATVRAERIVTSGDGVLFPIDPFPRCVVGNNFGGDSKVFGSGAHEGVDIAADQGQEVYAVEDGFLYRRYEGGSPGNGWGLWSVTDVKYRYFHLSAFAPGLGVGDTVTAGQLIGFVGDTGNAAPGGYHLHFEVRPGPQPVNGDASPVDPVPLLDIPTVCTVYPKQ